MEIFNDIMRMLVPYKIRKRRYYVSKLNGVAHEKKLESLVRDISNRNQVSVLFIACTLQMWRYQGVYERLCQDSRFIPRIIIAPFGRLSAGEKIKVADDLRSYFLSKGINVPSVTDDGFNLDIWFSEFDPDLIFYCQQYTDCFGNILDYEKNLNRLFGFVPYGLITIKENFVYNAVFNNLAWRIYHPTMLHLKTAKCVMANDARNVRVVGEPNSDRYFGSIVKNPWKVIDDGKQRKKIIWAPHFSINEAGYLHHDSFLWLFEGMVELAKKYADKVQFAFKPHPLLYTTLCERADWGKKRTDQYYELWRNMPNTQFEDGEFIDLFMSSDAMIHDCGSFTGEYMYTRKPVMFMSRDIKSIYKSADDFGEKCLDLHYVGNSINDAEYFLNTVVLKGADQKSEDRENFFNTILKSSEVTSVADNIYKNLVDSLGLH